MEKFFLRDSRRSSQLARWGRNWSWAFIRAVFILGFCFVILYPILSMLTRAFMEPRDLYDNSVLWLPKHFTLDTVALCAKALHYGRSFWNSLWSSLLLTVLQVAACLLAGYAFARYRFPGCRFLFACVILTLIVPPQLTMISSYMYFGDFDVFHLISLFHGGEGLNLLDTEWPLLLMAATGQGLRNGLFIFMFRQFFRSAPKETEEAAMIDGAGHFRTFFFVMLPGAVSVIITVILFSFVWQWNDVFYVNLYNRSFMSLTNYIHSASYDSYAGLYGSYAGISLVDPIIVKNLTSTSVLLIVAPLVGLFLLLQRYFVESVERSGVVG